MSWMIIENLFVAIKVGLFCKNGDWALWVKKNCFWVNIFFDQKRIKWGHKVKCYASEDFEKFYDELQH